MLKLGLRIAAVTFLIDQASKWFLINVYDMPAKGLVEVTGFFNLRMVWNRGVSFGMFSADTAIGRYALIIFALLVVGFLVAWLARADNRLLGISLGFVIGGALANVVDRAVYGAVADFFDFFAWGYHFYTFNVADAGISLGVMLLIYESIFVSGSSARKAGHKV